MRVGIASFVLLLFSMASLFGQQVGKIAGTVKDATTGEPLIGCNVMLVGTTLGAATDLEGAYFILNIPPGKYDVQASMVGYDKVTQRDVIVNSNRTTNVEFTLSPTALEQKEVVIEATRPDVEREKTSTSAFVRSEEVQSLAGIRDVGDVIALAADVTDGHFRGGRQNEEYYTLQGMGIVNPLDNTSAFLPIMSAVEEVEVITSGFGAQYGNAQSGIVNISMKEGKSDKWRTTLDMRSRLPAKKHFGPSVYDPNANAYLALLLDSDVWLNGDPNSDNSQPYYGSMGSGLTSRYARDTLVQLAVAEALWMQSRRDMNANYGNKLDYSIEGTMGGPLSDQMRMFLALRTNVAWPTFPTPNPNNEVQVMGNIVADLKDGKAIRLSGGYTKEEGLLFPGSNGVGGYQRWLWDRITGVNYRNRTNLQLGARYSHALSPSTYYEIKVNTLFTRNRVGATPVPSSIPDSNSFGPDVVAWSFILPVTNNNSPDGLNYQVGYDVFRDERSRTISFDGSISSQVTLSHLLNAGIQLNSYNIDVSNVINLRNDGFIEDYESNPFELALYAQDKMEFQGMIANIGLRLDLWSAGSDYYVDPFLPFGLPDSDGVFHPESAPQETPPVLGRLQPRAGVSFPVFIGTVFHLNYGTFMQRPAFQYLSSTRVEQGTNRPVIIGNPRLEPEVTNSYDIGVTQALGEGLTLDVSGYYKDVKNLIEAANFIDVQNAVQVNSYYNLDYADIRGFRVALTKRKGNLQGSLNYQYGFATGKSATVTAATPIFSRDTSGTVTTDLTNVPIRDITLDFDRTHNFILNLIYDTGRDFGPEVFGGKIFSDVALSASSFFRSGRPYTSTSSLKLINEERAPSEYQTNMRLTKRIPDFFGMRATFYFEVFNLFNDMIINYDYLFRKPTPTNPNLPLQYYEDDDVNKDLDHPEGPRYWYNKATQGPFAIDQSFLIYDNPPRSFSLGFSLDF